MSEEKHEGSYYAVLPWYVLKADISDSAKVLCGFISAFTSKDGFCTASNEYLAKTMGVGERQVQKLLTELTQKELIAREISKDCTSRKIFIKWLSEPKFEGGDFSVRGGTNSEFVGGRTPNSGVSSQFTPKVSKSADFSQKSDQNPQISQNSSFEICQNEKEKSFPPLSLTPLSSSSLKNPISNTPYNPLTPISKEERETLCARDPRELLFDEFWKAYPKKNSKKYAHQAFMNIKGLSKVFPTMMNALEKQKQSNDWFKDHGQYIPNPATWIHQERWNDEGVKDTSDGVSEALRERYPEWFDDDGGNDGNDSNEPF